jgi:hypothetical protein
MPSRSRPASAGASPDVEIAIVTPSRRTTPPRYAGRVRRIVDGIHEDAARLARPRATRAFTSASPRPRRTTRRQIRFLEARSFDRHAGLAHAAQISAPRRHARAARAGRELGRRDRTGAHDEDAAPVAA